MTDPPTKKPKKNKEEFLTKCLVCFKPIRNATCYKVHLTSPFHLKKKEAKARNGQIPPPNPLPEWTDIIEYLKYLKLDEPIVGLDSLVQIQDTRVNGKTWLQYRCDLCNVENIMCNMVLHVVGQKHRYVYTRLKRPDLYKKPTSIPRNPQARAAKIRAAIVEKQEGWGTPSVDKRPTFTMRLRSASKRKKKATQKEDNQDNPETSSPDQDEKEEAHLPEDGYRLGDFSNDDFGDMVEFHGDDKNGHSSGDTAHWQSYLKNDKSKKEYSQDSRQRPYEEEGYKEKPYLEGDGSVRSFVEGDSSGRHHTDRAIPRRSFHSESQDEYYPEMNPRRGWNPSGDVHHDSFPRNRFADTESSGSSQLSNTMDYQVEGQIEGQMYASPEGRGHGMEEMQRPSTSFHYTEKEGDYLQDFIREARAEAYKTQPYANRGGFKDYAQEHVQGKTKRQSRFSDATPTEVEIAQKRFKESVIPPKNQSRGPLQAFEERNASEDVLDVLDGIQIDTAEEAYLLKQKLCDVLKEFRANKSRHAEVSPSVSDYSPRSDGWMDKRWSGQETRKSNNCAGFQETTRYDRDNRDFQETRTFTNDFAGVQDRWQPERNAQDVQDPRYVENQRHVQDMQGYEKNPHHKTTRYDTFSTDFQESRRYEGTPADSPWSGKFKDKPRDFQQERGLYDNSRDVERSGRFKEDPRSIQSMRHMRGTNENRSYGENFEREMVGRRGDHDFRHGRSDLDAPRQFEWDAKRERSGGRSDEFRDYHQDVERRAYQGGHWKTRSLTEDAAYNKNQANYQRDIDPSNELYDPFHPSSSPPQEA